MQKIRLARGGSKKAACYRIVVADSRAPRDGRFIEKVGYYNAYLTVSKKEKTHINLERLEFWLSKGAQMTETVEKLYKIMKETPETTSRSSN